MSKLPAISRQAALVDKVGRATVPFGMFLELLQGLVNNPVGNFGGGWNNVVLSGTNATPDLSLGQSQYILANIPLVHIQAPNTVGDDPWFMFLAQDGTGGRKFTFDASYILHAALPQTLSLAPNTYNALVWVTNPGGRQMLVYSSSAFSAA